MRKPTFDELVAEALAAQRTAAPFGNSHGVPRSPKSTDKCASPSSGAGEAGGLTNGAVGSIVSSSEVGGQACHA